MVDTSRVAAVRTSIVDGLIGQVISGQSPYPKWDSAQLLARGCVLAERSDVRALPMLLAVCWQESKREDVAKTLQAAALYALRQSDVWHKYAEKSVSAGNVEKPSWHSFVRDYLPMKYVTTIERTNVIATYHEKLQWPVAKIAAVGFSKLQTARRTVEKEIEETGTIEPETERILTEETHEGVLMHVAGQAEKVGFSYRVLSGHVYVHFPESVCASMAMAHIMTLERPPDGVAADVWQEALSLIVQRLRATIVDAE